MICRFYVFKPNEVQDIGIVTEKVICWKKKGEFSTAWQITNSSEKGQLQ